MEKKKNMQDGGTVSDSAKQGGGEECQGREHAGDGRGGSTIHMSPATTKAAKWSLAWKHLAQVWSKTNTPGTLTLAAAHTAALQRE